MNVTYKDCTITSSKNRVLFSLLKLHHKHSNLFSWAQFCNMKVRFAQELFLVRQYPSRSTIPFPVLTLYLPSYSPYLTDASSVRECAVSRYDAGPLNMRGVVGSISDSTIKNRCSVWNEHNILLCNLSTPVTA